MECNGWIWLPETQSFCICARCFWNVSTAQQSVVFPVFKIKKKKKRNAVPISFMFHRSPTPLACIWQFITLFHRKSTPLRYAGTRSFRLTSPAEEVDTLPVDVTFENLLCVKVSLLFSIHQYHPTVHLSRLKLQVNQHQIILPICFISGKPHTFGSADTYSDSRVNTAEIKSNSEPNRVCVGFILWVRRDNIL